jgi:hypothetical protein
MRSRELSGGILPFQLFKTCPQLSDLAIVGLKRPVHFFGPIVHVTRPAAACLQKRRVAIHSIGLRVKTHFDPRKAGAHFLPDIVQAGAKLPFRGSP